MTSTITCSKMSRLRVLPRAMLGLAALSAACLDGSSSSSMAVTAPARLQQALSVVGDLGCQARLVNDDGTDVTVDLERADDGVTFSGFLETVPGRYVLELTFSGVVTASAGDGRRFLGRLRSDDITVVTGDVQSPVFSTPLDTIGSDGDDGDEDSDGLGFLDELILGSSPDSADSDSDSVPDGLDCRPANPVVDFAISSGGTVDDCDADGFIAVDAVFADSGNDCTDTDPAINPAAEDDCGTISDQDCNPSTCPVNDAEGPSIRIDVPADAGTHGCGMRVTAAVSDPSGVETVFATFVDDPFDTGERIVVMSETATAGIWQSQPITAAAGLGFRSGSHQLEVKAFDGTGNSNSVEATFTLVTDGATVTVTGPAVIADAAADVTFSAQSDDDIVRFVVFSSTPSPQAPSTFDFSTQTIVEELPVTGGTVRLDPATVSARTAVYAVVEDAAGRLSSPTLVDFTSVNNGTARRATCDGDFNATVPVVIVEPPPDAADTVTLQDLLPEAVQRAVALDATARLSSVVALAIDDSGRVNLGDTGSFIRRWVYRFLKSDGRGITVTYVSAAFGGTRPTVEDNITDPFDDVDMVAAANPASLQDSDTLIALYTSSGCGAFTGNDSDQLVISRSGARDQAIIVANNGSALIVDAATLEIISPCN